MIRRSKVRKVMCLHVAEATRRWWVLSDGVNTMRGGVDVPREQVVDRWNKTFGVPDRYVTVGELHTLAEAAASLGDLALDAEKTTDH